MRGRTRAMAAAAFTSIALVATACGGGGTPSTSNSTGGQAGAEITIRGCTPTAPLIPGNTTEVCGGNVIDAMAAKLVHYDPKTAAPTNDIAESIESNDNQNFTVKLKPGYKFHDGTEVKAKNFVDAWNWVAYAPNGQANSYFFAPIAGYGDVQCPDEECKQKPKAEKMSGLKVVDDTTFTIKTTEPVSNLPLRLGYTAFAPLPDSFFADPKAFEDKPIGAGPFQLQSKTTTEIVLTKFADYAGEFKPNVDKVTFRIYTDDAAAYADLVSGQLDFTDHIPTDQLVGEAYKNDLPDRNSITEGGRFTYLTFSPNDPQLKNNVALRKALSRAIDRDLIAKQIFNGTVIPATGWVSPSVDGYKPDTCGESCKFDAAAAKQAFEAAGGYDGTLTMTYNADTAGNKEYSEAVCNSIKNAVGVNCVASPVVDFATYNKKLDDNSLKGLLRTGWQMDYPSIENFLTPIYAKGADSNYSHYDNPEFTKLINQAAAAKTTDAANVLYQQAEALLARDMPTAPLWYPSTVSGWSEKVTDVTVTAFGTLDLIGIKTK
ncbi:MAG: oligopeptide transport system substrate-binding protein [Propionibacteriaceae bacterium]|nr:oligopeptide transport system substrate-binding protein [Propionibacteriaceae bacterium]